MRIAIVTGEVSGDQIAAALIRALRSIVPNCQVEGILGPRVIEEGGRQLFDMERLAVMGITEPLRRLPELLWIRHRFLQHLLKNPPDLFIGVDAPEFNLTLECQLKARGIPTVHYVSPSVWAWRQKRIFTIQRGVDLMLTLFPFEATFYEKYQVPVCFTGHPYADEIPLEVNKKEARQLLQIEENATVCAILPGSRDGEIKRLAKLYLETAAWCCLRNKNLFFIIPVVSKKHKEMIEELHRQYTPLLPIHIVVNGIRPALSACDVALVTSGTATLEVMLHKKPMVVAYKTHPLTYQIAKRLVKVPYISLPNLIAEKALVPEFIQEALTPEALGQALFQQLSPDNVKKLESEFLQLHHKLKKDASQTAARAILDLLQRKGKIKRCDL